MSEKLLVLLSVVGLSIGGFAAYTRAAEKKSPAPEACGQGVPGCATACAPAKSSCSAPTATLSPAEQKAADWVVGEIRKAGSIEGAMKGRSAKAFLASGGFDGRDLDLDRVKQGVQVGLQACGSELGVTRCDAYGACAIGTDLSEATGPLLEKYRKQKSEDGEVYQDRQAPAFALQDIEGRTVWLADYRGRRLALVFWQSHCSHSQKSLPVWGALRKELAGKNFEVVTVLFNGGEAKDVKQWYGKLGQGLPVLLAPSEKLAEAYGSHLVPSVFLIDEAGRLVKKLVTEQPADKLRRELTEFAQRRA